MPEWLAVLLVSALACCLCFLNCLCDAVYDLDQGEEGGIARAGSISSIELGTGTSGVIIGSSIGASADDGISA